MNSGPSAWKASNLPAKLTLQPFKLCFETIIRVYYLYKYTNPHTVDLGIIRTCPLGPETNTLCETRHDCSAEEKRGTKAVLLWFLCTLRISSLCWDIPQRCCFVSPCGFLRQFGNEHSVYAEATLKMCFWLVKNGGRWGWEEGFAFQLQLLAIIILPSPL